MGPRPMWAQGVFGPGARLGSGTVWARLGQVHGAIWAGPWDHGFKNEGPCARGLKYKGPGPIVLGDWLEIRGSPGSMGPGLLASHTGKRVPWTLGFKSERHRAHGPLALT